MDATEQQFFDVGLTLEEADTAVRAKLSPEEAQVWTRYLDACTDYLKRQIIVYQNWPQRRFSPAGYTDEKVFNDQNA